MPRIARRVSQGYPFHLIRRGNNRSTTFFYNEDRQTYLKLLLKYSTQHFLNIWAYCLMENHVHLLAVPEKEDSLPCGVGLTNHVYTKNKG